MIFKKIVAAVSALDIILFGLHLELRSTTRTAVAQIGEIGTDAFFRMISEMIMLIPLKVIVAEHFVDAVLNLLRSHLLQLFRSEEQLELGPELARPVFITDFAGGKITALERCEIDRDAKYLQKPARSGDYRLVVAEH